MVIIVSVKDENLRSIDTVKEDLSQVSNLGGIKECVDT